LDTQPRTLTEKQRSALKELSHLVVSQLEMRRNVHRLKTTLTEKEQIEERVAESERRLLAIIDTVSEGITLCDENGFFEVFNPRMEELSGYSRNELTIVLILTNCFLQLKTNNNGCSPHRRNYGSQAKHRNWK